MSQRQHGVVVLDDHLNGRVKQKDFTESYSRRLTFPVRLATRQRALYLPRPVRPGEVVDDKGLGVDLSETLGDVGTDPRASSPRHTHHSHEPGQSLTALHLSPHQLLHSLSVTRAVHTEPDVMQEAVSV